MPAATRAEQQPGQPHRVPAFGLQPILSRTLQLRRGNHAEQQARRDVGAAGVDPGQLRDELGEQPGHDVLTIGEADRAATDDPGGGAGQAGKRDPDTADHPSRATVAGTLHEFGLRGVLQGRACPGGQEQVPQLSQVDQPRRQAVADRRSV